MMSTGSDPVESTGPARGTPLSHPQRRIWLTEQMSPGTAVGNIAGMVHIWGPVDPSMLARAAEGFLRDTATLHAVIEVVEGEPRQVPSPHAVPTVNVVNFSAQVDA